MRFYSKKNYNMDIPNHVYQALEKEVRKLWKDFMISDIKLNRGQAIIKVNGIGSTVCQYVKREHGAGTRQFYFILKKNDYNAIMKIV